MREGLEEISSLFALLCGLSLENLSRTFNDVLQRFAHSSKFFEFNDLVTVSVLLYVPAVLVT